MATSKLPALGRPVFQPPDHPCHACGASWAGRGFPNDVWFCTACVPPHMRFPWEAGYAPLAQHLPAPAPIAALPAQAAFDLLPGSAPA